LHPALLLAPLLALITSQLFYAFLPYSRRNYLAILLLSGIGFGLGQPLAPRVPIHFRKPADVSDSR
jgi:hypothetical protein